MAIFGLPFLYYGGNMKNLKIYYISENYINYLRQFDSNVAYNKNTTRP